MQIKLNDVIATPFHSLFKPIFESEVDEIVLKGGRGSSKSSVIPLCIVFGMMKDYHEQGLLTNAVCLRKIGKGLARSVYNNIIWAIDMLSVSDDWYCTKSPMQCIYKPSGQKIVFSGCDDPKKIKSIKFDKGYCKYSWLEELDEFRDMSEVRNVNQSLARGGKNIIFYSFNPPPSINNWCNFEFTKDLSYRLVHHSTYLDIPGEWLGESFIRIAEQLKEDNYKAYENEYLGKIVGQGGEIFTNVTNYSIDDEDLYLYDKIRNGIDFGFTDPLAFVRVHYDNNEMIVLDEIYQTHLKLDPMFELLKSKMDYGELIRGDSRHRSEIEELKQMGLNIIGAKKPSGSIDRGIKYLQRLDSIKIDRKRCPNTFWEFSTYEKEKDAQGNYRADYPDKNNHSIDACRYALSDLINIKGWKVPKVSKERKECIN